MAFFKKKEVPEVPKKIENEIVQCLVCPCNGKLYKNLKQHQTTVIHKNWELPKKISKYLQRD